ncbi:MAG: RdgB/HAM1 family non-canonical purine NTP pyrophosphatase [Bdellovibrionales bacterium]
MRKIDKLIIATHNQGKLKEFRALLADQVSEVLSAGELGLPEPEETGVTFYENARLKACAAAEATGLPALADDSGLCVSALHDAPGIYSARWAKEAGGFPKAMARIHQELGNTADRHAYFICSLVLYWPDGEEIAVEGRCDGTLVWPPRGSGGHGYDPMFVPEGETNTFAEMEASVKDEQSHRGRALQKLQELFNGA